MPTLGYISIFISLVIAVYATLAAFIGVRRGIPELTVSARNAALAYTALTTLAILILVVAFYAHDFSIAIVANSTSRQLDTLYTVTALWSNQAGSLLFWSWILSLYTTAVIFLKSNRDKDLMPYVIATIMAIQTFFAFMLSFVSNPFARWWTDGGRPVMALFPPAGASLFVPADGQGLNPILQHPAMAFHPPMLYLGYVGWTIPFAFAIAALLTRRVDTAWIRTTRRWTMAPWLFLAIGLMMGGRWAYDVLGWGGYWGWDPVENAAFMPWLAGTAFLHSVIVQERKGIFKVWNMGLIIITFSLVLFGTFLTRSGVIQSVHSFTESDIGVYFLSFIAIITLAATAILFTRIKDLKSEREIDSVLSREALFLLNNLLLVGLAFVILWGTVYPLFSELVYNEKLTVGPPYFNRVAAPIFAALLFVMAIIPLIGWSGASGKKFLNKLALPFGISLAISVPLYALGITDWFALAGYFLATLVLVTTAIEIAQGARARAKNTHENIFTATRILFERNRQRYGGYLVHIAIAMMAIGIIGSQVYATDSTRPLELGKSFDVRGYTLKYEKLDPNVARGEGVATVATVGVFRGGQRIATLQPERIAFERAGENDTKPAILSSPQEDLYVIIAGWEDGFKTMTFRAYVNPLVFWLWFGGLCLIVSTLIAAGPDYRVEARIREDRIAKESVRA